MNIIEVMIAAFGLIVACLQVRLSKQINEQNNSKEKGYFVTEYTNVRKRSDSDYKKFVRKFDLKNELRFYLSGNGDVFVLQRHIKVNGQIRESKELLETFFSKTLEEAPLSFPLPLLPKDEKNNNLDIEISFILKNVIGYKYMEKIYLEFERDRIDELWELKKLNINFEKVKR